MSPREVSDPLMHASGPDVFWTTVNAAEARPGVSTPLSQSFWGDAAELAARQAFCDMGVIPPSEVRVGSADENIAAVFYGRCAANVDTLRAIADRTPGMSGDGLERQFLGAAREGVPVTRARGRSLVVAGKAPRVLVTSARMMRRLEPDYEQWWRARVAAAAPSTGALNEARRRFEIAMWLQLRVTYLAQGLFDALVGLAEQAGHPGLERELVAGYGSLVENKIVTDLHAITRGKMPIDAFQRRWGFHGPREGELMSRSWRESTAALDRAIDGYRARSDADPVAEADERRRTREASERLLLDGLSGTAALRTRALLRLVRTYVPMREVGKAMYVMAIDAARASARAIGAQWAAAGRLADPEDVWFLTIPELAQALPVDVVREIVDVRRTRHREYEQVRLPRTWTGMPEPIAIDAAGSGATGPVIRGTAVSKGETVDGIARVILDPDEDAPLEPGEILVCETTDPSWVATFVSASALVIDIGGPLSHGAIVARELGIPAVVNTGTGTRAIVSGDHLRVDGAAGTVEVLAPLTTSLTNDPGSV